MRWSARVWRKDGRKAGDRLLVEVKLLTRVSEKTSIHTPA